MKKLLSMAVVAMLACGAQAAISFEVDVMQIEEGGYIKGTVPASVVVRLVDKGDWGKGTIYTETINFAGDAAFRDYLVTTDKGQTRFNVEGFIKDHKGSTGKAYKFLTANKGAMITIDTDAKNGVSITLLDSTAVDYDKVFKQKTDAQIAEYAESGNLRTEFEADAKVKDIPVTYNMSGTAGSNTLGSNVTLRSVDPVPEPTSGVLLMMGLAGLALKRKRVA